MFGTARMYPEAQMIKSQGLFDLWKYLQEANTHPEISRVLMARLTSWAFKTRQYPLRAREEEVLAALAVQDGIRWTPFFEGCIRQDWADIQNRYPE
jgi:hypothetical protein